LRSKKYEQGKGQLRSGNKFCCMGVGCDLFGKENSIKWKENSFMRALRFLPFDVMRWLGLNDDGGAYLNDKLTCLNDDGTTFDRIADIIESEPEGLFKE